MNIAITEFQAALGASLPIRQTLQHRVHVPLIDQMNRLGVAAERAVTPLPRQD
jgi:hypothetical protein